MDILINLEKIYFQLLNQQEFVEAELDYNIFNQHISFLDQMAKVKNSGLSVFDLYNKTHLYYSLNMKNLFGYDLNQIEEIGTAYYNSRIHSTDLLELTRIGIDLLRFIYKLPIAEKRDYKVQNEYRILNAKDKYIRIIEQFQVLELDKRGNVWLVLSVVDISPNQENYEGVRSQLINIKTGENAILKRELTTIQENSLELSKREREILNFVKGGFLSKEISNKLSISVHTVNTHRQNILKKLNVNNSIEAIDYATKLGLV